MAQSRTRQPLLPLGAQAKTVAVDVEKELDAPLAQKQAEALAGRVKLDTAKDEVAGVGGVNGVLDVGGGGEPVGVGGGRGWVRGIDVMSRRGCERSSSPQEDGAVGKQSEAQTALRYVNLFETPSDTFIASICAAEISAVQLTGNEGTSTV